MTTRRNIISSKLFFIEKLVCNAESYFFHTIRIQLAIEFVFDLVKKWWLSIRPIDSSQYDGWWPIRCVSVHVFGWPVAVQAPRICKEWARIFLLKTSSPRPTYSLERGQPAEPPSKWAQSKLAVSKWLSNRKSWPRAPLLRIEFLFSLRESNIQMKTLWGPMDPTIPLIQISIHLSAEIRGERSQLHYNVPWAEATGAPRYLPTIEIQENGWRLTASHSLWLRSWGHRPGIKDTMDSMAWRLDQLVQGQKSCLNIPRATVHDIIMHVYMWCWLHTVPLAG